MKRIARSSLSTLGIVCLLLSVIVAVWATPAISAPEVFKLRMQSCDPPALLGPSTTVPGFIDRVKKMSNGRIDIKLYTASQLVPTLEITKALKMGMIDMAYTSGAYYLGTIPEAWLESVNLPPGLLRNTWDGMEIYWYRGLDEIIRQGYAKHGVHYLKSVFLGDPLTYWTKKPLGRVADLKGLKIRAYGTINKVFAKLGATPTFIPHEEVYTSMAQGVIDGSFTAGSYYRRFKYYEVAPNYNLPGWIGFATMNLLVSQKMWNKLPDDLKAIMNAAAITFSVDHMHRLYIEHEQMLAAFKELGVNLVTWPEAEMDKIREASMTFLPDFSKKSEGCAKGIQIIKDYMKERGYVK